MPLIDNNPEKALTVEHFVAGFWIILFGLLFATIAFVFEKSCCLPKSWNEEKHRVAKKSVPAWVVSEEEMEKPPQEA